MNTTILHHHHRHGTHKTNNKNNKKELVALISAVTRMLAIPIHTNHMELPSPPEAMISVQQNQDMIIPTLQHEVPISPVGVLVAPILEEVILTRKAFLVIAHSSSSSIAQEEVEDREQVALWWPNLITSFSLRRVYQCNRHNLFQWSARYCGRDGTL